MRRIPLPAFVLLGVVLPVAPAYAGDTVCAQDGVARLCATAQEVQDVTGINYDVTQQDGLGSYQIHYEDLTDPFSSIPQNVGPLQYQQHEFGTMFGDLGHCFRVVLTSAAGTSLNVEPVCP